MPLPKYLLEQPSTNPLESISRRILSFGVSASLQRRGTTVVIRNLDHGDTDHNAMRRAMRIITEHADASKLTCEAFVPSVMAATVADYEANGFHVVLQADEEDEDGAHVVLRRATR